MQFLRMKFRVHLRIFHEKVCNFLLSLCNFATKKLYNNNLNNDLYKENKKMGGGVAKVIFSSSSSD